LDLKSKISTRIPVHPACTDDCACIAWIFFHADFPLQGRDAINLILFWIPVAIASLGTGILIKLLRAITQKELLDAKTWRRKAKVNFIYCNHNLVLIFFLIRLTTYMGCPSRNMRKSLACS
jgi:hypothetical protein